jgi:hypothetical protein
VADIKESAAWYGNIMAKEMPIVKPLLKLRR